MKFFLKLFLIISVNAKAEVTEWRCRLLTDEGKEILSHDSNRAKFKITKETFVLNEFFESQGNPKGIEYSLTCYFQNQSCIGHKLINVPGMKRRTDFKFHTSTKGSELREFETIRYFAKIRTNRVSVEATHRDKVRVECRL